MKKIAQFWRVLSPQTWRLLALVFGIFLLPAYAFVQLADEVRDRETIVFDETVLRLVNNFSSPLLDALAIGLTQLGGIIGVVVMTVGLALLLWVRNQRQKAALLMVGVVGGVLLNLLLKAIFQRDRPELWERLVTESSYSFPSGHAMASAALGIGLIVILWPTRWRWLAVAIAIVYMVIIGLTRLYLGVHYPTDIAAGWLVSGSWVLTATVCLHKQAAIRRWFHRLTN